MNPIRLTHHARKRMAEMRLDKSDVLGFIRNAEVTYTDSRYTGDKAQTVHQCDDYAVVTADDNGVDVVITVLYRGHKAPDRRWDRTEETKRRHEVPA